MERLWLLLLLLAPLTGCVGMEEFYYEDMAGLEWAGSEEGGCSACQGNVPVAGTLLPGSGVIQAAGQAPLPAQTREPELLTPSR